jgi:alpha-ribazole phosphatase
MKIEPAAYSSQGSFQGWIYLLRHGAVRSAGSGKRYVGTQDLALSDMGLGQARAWSHYFANLSLEAIYCSDLIRCLETASIIGAHCGLEPQAMLQLREVNLGAWEGQRFDTVKTLDPHSFQERGDHIADHHPPGGESFRDLQKRVWPIFEAAVSRRRNQTLIVTHAGVIRVLLCRLLGMPLDNLFRIGQAYGALNIIEVRPEGYRVQAMNIQPPE